MRYGFENIVQINSMRWRKMIADDLGITTHFTKWRSGDLATRFNCRPDASGKFRAKEWALDGDFRLPDEIPDWPDIVKHRRKRPRQEGSTAKAEQPDDRYDALAIMFVWLRNWPNGVF